MLCNLKYAGLHGWGNAKQQADNCSGKIFAQGGLHVGPLIGRRHDPLLPYRSRLRTGMRKTMTPWELVMALVMAVGLTTYLVYAMLRPEKF
jgi:K+-transporting ATPase KdpF subunit